MASLVVFSDAGDGEVRSSNSTYLTARAGSTKTLNGSGSTAAAVGQQFSSPNYVCLEAFMAFDTSALGASATVSSAVLSTYFWVKNGGAWTHRARLYDFGTAADTADYVAGASLSANTLLAHKASSGLTLNAYNDFVDDAFAANVNKTGQTRIVVATDHMESATVPTGNEFDAWYLAEQAGTSNDPKLTVTYTLPSAGSSIIGQMGFFGV